jgi:O-antigen biosynthesis protein WbqP
MTKRLVDVALSFTGILLLSLPFLVIAALVKLTSKGPAIHWSKRIGRYNKIFLMPKFRSMFIETPQVATHLLKNTDSFVTPLGHFLRKTSLDEIPQLYSVFVGDMSLVGPRPALFNQDDLVALRTEKGIQNLRPGVTGWAQINGRDDLPIPVKVEFDFQYLQKMSFAFDFKILCLTVFKVLKSDGVKH